ncbi:unnamed protein product, partial [Closterium sp. Naga37s-1]
PLVRTTVVLIPSIEFVRFGNFLLRLPAGQVVSGTMACSVDTGSIIRGDAKVTVVWNASKPFTYDNDAPSNAMCKSLSFYADGGCTEKLGFTIARPAKKGSSYPVTKTTVKGIKSLGSVGCEITMCENDCGSSQCVVKDGQQQCQCPEGLVFNAAKKRCHDPSLASRRAGGQGKKGRP